MRNPALAASRTHHATPPGGAVRFPCYSVSYKPDTPSATCTHGDRDQSPSANPNEQKSGPRPAVAIPLELSLHRDFARARIVRTELHSHHYSRRAHNAIPMGQVVCPAERDSGRGPGTDTREQPGDVTDSRDRWPPVRVRAIAYHHHAGKQTDPTTLDSVLRTLAAPEEYPISQKASSAPCFSVVCWGNLHSCGTACSARKPRTC